MNWQELASLPVNGEEPGHTVADLRHIFEAAFGSSPTPPKECPNGHKYQGPFCPTCGWQEPEWDQIAWPTNGGPEE